MSIHFFSRCCSVYWFCRWWVRVLVVFFVKTWMDQRTWWTTDTHARLDSVEKVPWCKALMCKIVFRNLISKFNARSIQACHPIWIMFWWRNELFDYVPFWRYLKDYVMCYEVLPLCDEEWCCLNLSSSFLWPILS